jgi:lipopolysaccharide/colanic/teichoic acid biosynthesis glycosyltransferase
MSRSALPYSAITSPSRVSLYQPPFPRLPHISTRSALKRLIDIAGALLGLAILSLLYLPIAIAIRLDSPGPTLYSQERFGLQGKPFRIWKFRSMVSNADELKSSIENEANGLIFKNKADPRVTRVGQFLRKTSLDEFPQFWNVLKGEMSLVGTRPPTGDEVKHYSEHHWKRLDVRPGLTGQWQVSGRSAIKDFEEIVELDLHYQRHWSPIYDIQLIVKTITTILSKKSGAY